jgi:hypothetical protein
MGDQIIITDDEPKAKPEKPEVVVIAPQPAKTEKKVVTEKVTVSETTDE